MTKLWTMAARPEGLPKLSDFELQEAPSAPLPDGFVRVENRWLSLDPATRVRMIDMESYLPKFEIGQAITGTALGSVIESRSTELPVGARVKSQLGWRNEAVGIASEFQLLPNIDAPEEAFMGPLGATGMTAMVGLRDVASDPSRGTILVTGAAGATGSIVVQLAKLSGLTVVAAAGGNAKCTWLREIGADAVIDYKAPGAFEDKLHAACPEGIDICFDNVGGEQLDAAIGVARDHARIVLCGMIAAYQDRQPLILKNAMRLLTARIRMQGFLILEYADRFPAYMEEMAGLLRHGSVRMHSTVTQGIESVPHAFIGLFQGTNIGKSLVRL